MKNYRPIVFLTLAILTHTAHAGFFGPDVVTLSPPALREKLHGQPLALAIHAAPLEFKSKSAAIGGVLIGFFLTSALASGADLRPGMTMQQQMQNLEATSKIVQEGSAAIATATTEMLNAQAAKTAGVQAKEGPISLLAPQLQAAFMQAYGNQWRPAVADNADQADAAKMRLDIRQPTWMVDFSMTSSDYHVGYKLDMVLTDLAAKEINRSVACEGVYDRTMSDDDWKKDDFQAVADAAKGVAELCLDKFLGDLVIARASAAIEPVSTVEAADVELPENAGTESAMPAMQAPNGAMSTSTTD